MRYGPKHLLDVNVGELYRRGMRLDLSGLRVVQDLPASALTDEELRKRKTVTHPNRWSDFCGVLAKVHPETGKRSLFPWVVFLEDIEGLGREASLDLYRQMLQPGCTGPKGWALDELGREPLNGPVYCHCWKKGDVLLWDNRSTFHTSTPLIPEPQLVRQCFLRLKTPMKEA